MLVGRSLIYPKRVPGSPSQRSKRTGHSLSSDDAWTVTPCFRDRGGWANVGRRPEGRPGTVGRVGVGQATREVGAMGGLAPRPEGAKEWPGLPGLIPGSDRSREAWDQVERLAERGVHRLGSHDVTRWEIDGGRSSFFHVHKSCVSEMQQRRHLRGSKVLGVLETPLLRSKGSRCGQRNLKSKRRPLPRRS